MDWQKGIGFFVFGFLGIIVLISIIAGLYNTSNTDALTPANLCGTQSCFYNASRTQACTTHNVTAEDTTACTAGESFPLSTIFTSGGALWVLVAAVLVLGIVMYYFKKRT